MHYLARSHRQRHTGTFPQYLHVYMLNNGICIPQRTIRIIISVVRKLISTQLYTLLKLVLYSRTLRVATKELTYYESSVGGKKITAIITVHST